MKIIVDMMGGDNAPLAVLEGTAQAVKEYGVQVIGVGSEELGAALGAMGVCVRAGMHCAPYAHESAGTLETGTVRLSVSPFNTIQEVRRVPALVQRAVEAAQAQV